MYRAYYLHMARIILHWHFALCTVPHDDVKVNRGIHIMDVPTLTSPAYRRVLTVLHTGFSIPSFVAFADVPKHSLQVCAANLHSTRLWWPLLPFPRFLRGFGTASPEP